MKNLFLLLIFVFSGKLLLASNCDAQFLFSVKNNSWKAVNSTISNGIIYIEVNSESDSLSFQLLKNNDCTTIKKISEIYFDDELINLPKDGGIIKSGSVGGLYKILIVTPGSSEWFKLFVKVNNPTAIKNVFSNRFRVLCLVALVLFGINVYFYYTFHYTENKDVSVQ